MDTSARSSRIPKRFGPAYGLLCHGQCFQCSSPNLQWLTRIDLMKKFYPLFGWPSSYVQHQCHKHEQRARGGRAFLSFCPALSPPLVVQAANTSSTTIQQKRSNSEQNYLTHNKKFNPNTGPNTQHAQRHNKKTQKTGTLCVYQNHVHRHLQSKSSIRTQPKSKNAYHGIKIQLSQEGYKKKPDKRPPKRFHLNNSNRSVSQYCSAAFRGE